MVILRSSVSNYVTLDDKTYSYFAGNNYLGLANHPSIIRDVVKSVEKYGINFSASRQTTGTSELHLELENLLSVFHQKPASIVFPSGYSGNRMLLHALRERYTSVYLDELAHPSIADGIPNNVSDCFRYRHCDTGHLEGLLLKNQPSRPLIITDGIFALTGELAPLDKIHFLAEKYGATIIVDEAHATGVMGENGRGCAEYYKIDHSPRVFQTGTMSKALGSYGGFISADKEVISYVRENSSPYLASTALPPPVVSAACSALKIIQNHPELRLRLFDNAQLIREGIREMGFELFSDSTPIIPLALDSEEEAIDLSAFLKENSIIVPYVKYPVKINKFIVRITASAIHTEDQINGLLAVIKKWRNKHGA